MAVRWIACADSTSTRMASEASLYAHGDALATHTQTAGRGQRGNSWEAEPGKNLTFSLMLRPEGLRAADAFHLSMAVSVGIVKALRRLLGAEVVLKWPNDIYVGDRKLCGILIENSLTGPYVAQSIVGIGINVNQTEFTSPAPNPVSMAQLAGHEFPLEATLAEVIEAIVAEYDEYERTRDLPALHSAYEAWLWRGKGEWTWHDNLTGETLRAAIQSVAPTGHLTLATNPPRTYAFKEVSAVL